MIEVLRRCQSGNVCIWQRMQSLGRTRSPSRLHLPYSSSTSTWGFAFLCSHPALLRTMSFNRGKKKKIIQTQVLGFPFQPPNHMLFNRKTADEPMTAKIHSSAMKKRVSSAVKWKRGSRGPQPARRNREGGDISHRNVVCRNLQS